MGVATSDGPNPEQTVMVAVYLSIIFTGKAKGDESPLTIDAASVRRCNDHLFNVAFLVME